MNYTDQLTTFKTGCMFGQGTSKKPQFRVLPTRVCIVQAPPMGYATYRIEKAQDAVAAPDCADRDPQCSQWAAEVRTNVHVHPRRCTAWRRPLAPDHDMAGAKHGSHAGCCCCRVNAGGVPIPCTPDVHCPAGRVITAIQEVCERLCIATANALVPNSRSV